MSAALKSRGVDLAQSLADERVARIEDSLGLKLSDDIRKIYSTFNGFLSSDKRSQISMWPADQILGFSNDMCEIEGKRFYGVGDVLVDSDFITCCLEDSLNKFYSCMKKNK